jgi:ribosomal protein L22
MGGYIQKWGNPILPPSIRVVRVDLAVSITTEYQQAKSSISSVPEKHWVEHRRVPPAQYNGMTADQIVEVVTNAKRNAQRSSVDPSILRNYYA